MKILSLSSGGLSNFEVFTVLHESKQQQQKQQAQSKRPKPTGEARHHDWIQNKVLNYLARSTRICKTSEQTISSFLQLADEFQLSSFERLQIMNRTPQSLVELWLLLENPEDRFGEEDARLLLERIKETLYLPTTNPDFQVYERSSSTHSHHAARPPRRRSSGPSPVQSPVPHIVDERMDLVVAGPPSAVNSDSEAEPNA